MKKLKKIIKFGIFSILFLIIVNLFFYLYAFLTPKKTIKKNTPYTFYDIENKKFLGNNSKWVKLKDIGNNVINATIAVEDKNFYKHKGFDYLRILKSMYLNVKKRKIIEGASTITQQYARNLYLNFDKSWKRKIDEALLTFELEVHYDKDEILEGYLNTINYGKGIYGIENAANYYFDKSSKDLNIAEASMLAGIPNSPANYSPLIDEYSAKKRQLTVLKMMKKNNYISEVEMEKYYGNELTYIGENNEDRLSTLLYYQDAVLNELKKIKTIPESIIKQGGIKIYTAFDIEAQQGMENSIESNMKEFPEGGISGVMMNPDNGEVIALTGGVDFSRHPYNRATKSKRQVGSAMKTFLYYSALENGFTASSTFLSSPTTFTFGNNQNYSPKNYAEKYGNKEISLAAAIAYSDNIYAVKTHMFLGEETLVDIAKRVGIDEELEAIPSLPLGTNEINIVDFVGGYGAFANEGYKVDPHLIKKIEDNKGNIIYEFNGEKEKVLDSSKVFILNELLSNTYNYNFLDFNTPTLLSISAKIKNKLAVKSGTTNTDYITIGYNPNIVVGIWFGYDDNREVKNNESKIPKYIWAETIESYLKDKEVSWYKMPENVVGVLVNPITGKTATEKDIKKQILYYQKGSEPGTIDKEISEEVFKKKDNG